MQHRYFMTKLSRFLTFAISVACAATVAVCAAPITPGQAQAIASLKMAGKTWQPVNLQNGKHAPRQGAYYIFNAQAHQGYVIVAGDDRLPAILGYSDTGSIDPDAAPPALLQLLDYYAHAIMTAPFAPATTTARPPIAPMTTSVWGQGEPFNRCLQFQDTTAQGDTIFWQAPTGCVTTAMAQLMYYHKWPDVTLAAIPEYTTATLSMVMPQLPDTTFAWHLMRDAYSATDSTDAAAAVACLNRYCAQALQTDLNKNGSTASAIVIPGVLAQYFGYAASARFVKRESYSTLAWEQLLHNELLAGRPVIYRAENSVGEHTFIVDGCDDTGLFHVNWGWDGQSNGYFVLSDLNPAAQATGGYIHKQAMVIGAQPDDGSPSQSHVRFHSMTVRSTSPTPVDSLGNYRVNVTGTFHNNSTQPQAFDYGWGLFLGDQMLDTLATRSRPTPLPPNYQVTSTFDLQFGAQLRDTTYCLRPIWSPLQAQEWNVCEGGHLNFIELTLAQDTCIYVLHGKAATPQYVAGDLTFTGAMRAGKPVTATASITNLGNTLGDPIYIFDNGARAYVTMADVDPGCTSHIHFHFTPDTAGRHTITLSLLESGSDTLFVQQLDIDSMPAVQLIIDSQVLNVTDTLNHIVTGQAFSIQANIVNTDTIAYDEDIVVRLCRVHDGDGGIAVQDRTLPLQLAAGDSLTITIDCDNVLDGQQYYCKLYYYSAGRLMPCGQTPPYTLVFPAAPSLPGDINGDGKVDIADVNAVINAMLGKGAPMTEGSPADINGDSRVDIADVNAVINLMLGKHR